MRKLLQNTVFLITLTFLMASVTTAQTRPDAASPEFFETKIRPILATNCYACHTASQLGGLRLDSPEAVAKGGKRGPAVTPGDPEPLAKKEAV